MQIDSVALRMAPTVRFCPIEMAGNWKAQFRSLMPFRR